MKLRQQSHGMAGMVILLIILLVAVIGYAGYTVFSGDDSEDIGDAGAGLEISDNAGSETSEPVQSADDVDEQLAELEEFDVDSELSTSTLDSELDF